MWAKVAEEMGLPWRAAEAMHWQLGEADMARRAGVVPFSLSSTGMGMHITEGPPMLPSVAEMTTGMSPYSTAAYSVSKSMFNG